MRNLRSVIVDTGFLIGLVKSDDAHHKTCIAALSNMPESCKYFTVESCLAESVFLLASAKSISSLDKVVDALPLQIQALSSNDLSRVFQLLNKYQDRRMDFADAALVAIAERMNIKTILTTDKRDFGIYRPKHTAAFEIIP